MKILLFAASFPPPNVGGSTQYLFNIVENLPANTVVVHTGNPFPEESREFDHKFRHKIIRHDFIHHPMEAHKRNGVRRALQYLIWPFVAFWLISRERPNIVHVGEGNTAVLGALAAKLFLNIPYLQYVYAEEITQYSNTWLRNKLFWMGARTANAIITVSEYSKQLLLDGGISFRLIHKIVPSISDEKCNEVSTEEKKLCRQMYAIEDSAVLLTVGAIKERKGQESVIDALPKIISHHPNVRYVIAGSGSTEEEGKLRKKVKNLNLENIVTFTGRVDNDVINTLYEVCDIFIMPHRQVANTLDTEGCPTVFLEASAHGKPVIGGDAGGVADAIMDNQTGFIIDGTNIDIITSTVCRLLDNRELRDQMGNAGRHYVRDFRPSKNAQKVWYISSALVDNTVDTEGTK